MHHQSIPSNQQPSAISVPEFLKKREEWKRKRKKERKKERRGRERKGQSKI